MAPSLEFIIKPCFSLEKSSISREESSVMYTFGELLVVAGEGLERIHAVAVDGDLLHRPAQVCADIDAERRRDPVRCVSETAP